MKILKAKRGISTIIAVLLMIVIAVAAAVITYIWIMGYLSGTMGKIEQPTDLGEIMISSIARNGTSQNVIRVVVRNIGDRVVTLDKLYVDGVEATINSGAGEIALEGTATVIATKASGNFVDGTPYLIKVECTNGLSYTDSWTPQA